MAFNKKIVIVNVHWNNRGDEAALKGLWINLKKKFPSHEITTVFKDKNPILDNLKNYTDKVVVNRFKEPLLKILINILFRGHFFKNEEISKLLKILINADLVVYGPGGSVISDNFYKYKQIEYLTPFMICYFFKIPFFVLGPSFGPFDHKKKFFLRNFLLKKTNNFCVREGISKSYVEEITKKNVKKTTDLSFSYHLNKDDVHVNELFKSMSFGENDKIIGISLSDFTWHVKFGNQKEFIQNVNQTYVEFIKYLVKNNFKVLLIPQLFGSQNDYDYLKKLKDLSTGIEVLDQNFDCDAQKKIISHLYATVGSRYHLMIFSTMMSVPNISINYDHKTRGFLRDCELEEWCIDLEELDYKKLKNLFDNLCKNREHLIERYKQLTPNLEKNSKSSFELFDKINKF